MCNLPDNNNYGKNFFFLTLSQHYHGMSLCIVCVYVLCGDCLNPGLSWEIARRQLALVTKS